MSEKSSVGSEGVKSDESFDDELEHAGTPEMLRTRQAANKTKRTLFAFLSKARFIVFVLPSVYLACIFAPQ